MTSHHDARLAANLSEQISKAEALLWVEMGRLGLARKDGWKVSESMRDVEGGCEVVLRPIHLYMPAPPGLECVARVIERDGSVLIKCNRAGDPPP